LKVFWSWQSDHPGKISRHFVKQALEQAITELNQAPDIDESVRDGTQTEVTLDHDRKDVPGSPDLANIILEKIRSSDVFVGDVSAVGRSETDASKKLINSNVAIELGFALNALTDRRLIMVMNERFGSRNDLPFDLKHKAGPIIYRLDPDATRSQIEEAKSGLVADLKAALKAMQSLNMQSDPVFEPESSIPGDPSRFVAPGYPLFNYQGSDAKPFFIPETPLLYLRIFPAKRLPPLKRADVYELVKQGLDYLEPFYWQPTGASFEKNKQGAIAYAASRDVGSVLSAVQLFSSRELWAFDSQLLAPGSSGVRVIPCKYVEHAYKRSLLKYLEFMTKKLAVPLPLQVTAGAAGIKGYALHCAPDDYGFSSPPQVYVENVEWSGAICSLETVEIERILLEIFDCFFDAAGERRPTGLFGFPATAS
jgi:hypothetical protein